MSIMTGFAILVGEAIIGFYKKIHAINFGVYGATMVGKTTLSKQLRTRGEVPQVNERTVGLHRASRKNIKNTCLQCFLLSCSCFPYLI